MEKAYVNNDIVTIEDDREYYLNLPHLVVGSIDTFSTNKPVFENDIISSKEIMYNQCFVKQIEEAIQNACDEFTRTNGDFANKIDIKIDRTTGLVSVKDNGRGIPLDKYVLSATNFKTGSNFTWVNGNESNKNIGTHGIGSKIITLFSKKYKMVTVTDEGRGTLICENNMSIINDKIDKAPASAVRGTYVEWIPDYERMGLANITDDLINHINALLINIAVSFPKITFTFNGKMIKVNSFRDYIKFISPTCSVLVDDENIGLAVFPTDEHKFVHIVNSIDINKGGTALTYITNNIVTKFTERLKKGYSKITTPVVKNRLGVILILRNRENLKFGAGQTKEELKNTVLELGLPTFDYTGFAEIIFKNNNIKNPINELYRIQQEMENRAKLSGMKTLSASRVDKFFPATKEKKWLYISEGESAKGLLMNLNVGITRKDCSFYSILGKPLNVLNASNDQIAKNKVLQDLVKVFETPLNGSIDTFSHQNVVIASDADADGVSSISGGLIAFFVKFYPELVKQGRLYRLYLPLMVAFDKKTNEPLVPFKDFNEYSEWAENNDESKYKIDYYKGLGGFDSETINKLFEKFGFEYFIEVMTWDENTENTLMNWMYKDNVQFRKDALTAEDAILNIGIA